MSNLKAFHDIYTANIAKFPALIDELANQLGVSAESVFKVGTGLIPLDEQGNWSWVFPERDAKGTVIGLNKRFVGGAKYMVKGSKRGLVYVVNHDITQYEKRQWTRVSVDRPCPLCGKPDGCLYPEREYDNPNAVICVHIATGSTKPMKLGYLHILDPTRQKLLTHNYSLLLPSEHPVLIVEGASDVCAAYDLGFTAVGKYTAGAKSKELVELLSGHKCVILGENDAGAGKAGMESTFAQLQTKCPDLTQLMPPEGVKDLRQWLAKGLTQEELLEYIETAGSQSLNSDIFSSDESLIISQAWLKDSKTTNGKTSFGIYRKGYVDFDGQVYKGLSDEQVHGQLYRDIGGKRYIDPTGALKPYKLTRAKVADILQACTSSCLIDRDPPCWLTPGLHPDPHCLIVFQNGILDVGDYMEDKITLHNPTSDLFTFNVLPYDFNEDLESELWDSTSSDILSGNTDKQLLLSQWFGYNLVSDMSQEKLMLFKGRIRSGKGTIAHALKAMLGKDNWTATDFGDGGLAGPFGYHPLIGKLCAVVGDTTASKTGKENAVLLKILNIVGRDSVSINVKGKPHLPDIGLCCRFTFAMNDFPTFRDDSGALEARTNILTFNNSYLGREDKTLKDRLAEEASSGKLINYALRGLKSLYTNGEFIVPEESAVALHTFRELVSPIPQFAKHCTELDKEGPGVAADYLYDLWKWWCGREGLKPGYKSTLIRNLLSTIPDAIQIMDGEVGNPDRMLMGIKVTQWAEEGFSKG